MRTEDEARSAIREYEERFRHPDIERLKVSGLCAFFPSTADPSLDDAANSREDPWPFNKSAGVYLIFDKNRELLYVGKASPNSTLGERLNNYFRMDEDGICRIERRGWSREPRYVITVAVPEAMRFEAPALEEYLITTLKPNDNTRGIRQCD